MHSAKTAGERKPLVDQSCVLATNSQLLVVWLERLDVKEGDRRCFKIRVSIFRLWVTTIRCQGGPVVHIYQPSPASWLPPNQLWQHVTSTCDPPYDSNVLCIPGNYFPVPCVKPLKIQIGWTSQNVFFITTCRIMQGITQSAWHFSNFCHECTQGRSPLFCASRASVQTAFPASEKHQSRLS